MDEKYLTAKVQAGNCNLANIVCPTTQIAHRFEIIYVPICSFSRHKPRICSVNGTQHTSRNKVQPVALLTPGYLKPHGGMDNSSHVGWIYGSHTNRKCYKDNIYLRSLFRFSFLQKSNKLLCRSFYIYEDTNYCHNSALGNCQWTIGASNMSSWWVPMK